MTDLKDRKLILALDFDGVIHDYKRGWQGGQLYGHATPGFFDWYLHTAPKFEIIIHSSRFGDPNTGAEDLGQMEAVRGWMDREYTAWRNGQPVDERLIPEHIQWQLSAAKPPAWLTIDDRCIRFDGDWNDEKLSVSGLFRFRPYNVPVT